jgi:predicted ester cyclase
VLQKNKEYESMELKGNTLKKTLMHDDSKLIQAQIMIEKEKEKLHGYVQTRYALLSEIEDQQMEVENLMAEKQALLAKKRDLKDSLVFMEDKYKELMSRGKEVQAK